MTFTCDIGGCAAGTCQHTQCNTDDAWFAVDLGSEHLFTHVLIQGRNGGKTVRIYLLQTSLHIHVTKIYIQSIQSKNNDKKCTSITYRDRLKTMQGNYYNG